MSDDKMRAEFEIATKQYNYLTVRLTDGDYADSETRSIWNFYQLGYQAGQKAEREAIQKEALQQLVDEAQKLDMGY